MTEIRTPTPIRRYLTRPAAIGLAVVAVEVLLVVGYLGLTRTGVTAPRYVIYPFVWINVGLWAIVAATPVVGNRRHRLVAGAVAIAYFVLLLSISGNLTLGVFAAPYANIMWATPGWGPVLNGVVPGLEFHLIPFEVIGYAGLTYLFYANALEISRGLLSGALGLVTCVSCSIPIWGPILGLNGGPAAGFTDVMTDLSYDIGTVIFLVTIVVLYYSQRTARTDRSSVELS